MTDVVNESIFQGYAYDYSALPPLAMRQGLPLDELPALDWIWKTTLVALRILSKELLGDHDEGSARGHRSPRSRNDVAGARLVEATRSTEGPRP